MTKADLAKELYERYPRLFTRKESFRIVEQLFETLKATLSTGESVQISCFGSFLVRKKGLRKGRNLQTGEEILIEPRTVVKFKPSNLFKAMVEKA